MHGTNGRVWWRMMGFGVWECMQGLWLKWKEPCRTWLAAPHHARCPSSSPDPFAPVPAPSPVPSPPPPAPVPAPLPAPSVGPPPHPDRLQPGDGQLRPERPRGHEGGVPEAAQGGSGWWWCRAPGPGPVRLGGGGAGGSRRRPVRVDWVGCVCGGGGGNGRAWAAHGYLLCIVLFFVACQT